MGVPDEGATDFLFCRVSFLSESACLFLPKADVSPGVRHFRNCTEFWIDPLSMVRKITNLRWVCFRLDT